MNTLAKKDNSRILSAISVFLALVVILLIVLLVILYSRNRAGNIGFKAYTPSSTSPELEVSEAKLVLKMAPFVEDHFDYVVTFKNTDAVLYQRKSNASTPSCPRQMEYSSKTSDYRHECEVLLLSNEGKGNVEYSYYKGRLFNVSLKARKQTTEFYMSIPQKESLRYKDYDWTKFFNSMRKTNTYGMRYSVEKFDPSSHS